MKVSIKRVYSAVGKTDGTRILIDRFWPRGISKEAAQIDVWLKGIAPSSTLIKWFAHDPEKMEVFEKNYSQELEQNTGPVNDLKQYIKKGKVTLLYGAKNETCNHAVLLQRFLINHK